MHDLSPNRHRLLIPERYVVLQKRVPELDPIDISDLDDTALNTLGFLPFGFIVNGYRRRAKPEGRFRNMIWVIGIGAMLSLIIELTQIWLPNRTSSTNDLIRNTLGTFLGAFLASKLSTGRTGFEENSNGALTGR